MPGEKPIQNHSIPFAAKFNNLYFKVPGIHSIKSNDQWRVRVAFPFEMLTINDF